MNWFSSFFTKTIAPESRVENEVRPPQLYQFNSVDEWLSSWVNFQINGPQSGHRTELPGGTGLYLFGSIGLDTAITPDGSFWINDWDISESDSGDNWKLASATERSSIIVSVQRKRFPELIALLPTRPQNAIVCSECNGTGYAHHNLVWCSTCGCLGWHT